MAELGLFPIPFASTEKPLATWNNLPIFAKTDLQSWVVTLAVIPLSARYDMNSDTQKHLAGFMKRKPNY